MSEWWTYGPRDLLLFSRETYYRLFELYNLEWWPLHVVALAAGGAIALLWGRGGAAAGRAIALILALAWAWVAWAFHAERYATIQLAASYFAWAFAVQALLLAGVAVAGRGVRAPVGAIERWTGIGLFMFALVGYPLLSPLMGGGWSQSEVFGMTPDPTALGTLGVLLFASARARWLLLPIPLLWCAVSGATLWAMRSPAFVVVVFGAGVALLVAALGGRFAASRRS